jgi:small subunit ribosomal protein S1
LEENPWDVFETVFTIDSIHSGTIMNINDKGATVAMPYGLEAFAPIRHLVKDDKTTARVDENLEFKILEFNKDSKKILVSHTRIHDDAVMAEKEGAENAKKEDDANAKKAVKKIKDSMEKTTLGDISALSDLKDAMDRKNK